MKAKKKNTNKRRKTNIFIVFLICSALIWLISKLSETYTQRVSFDLSFVNSPDDLLLTGTSKETVDVRLSASGFGFLGFNFGRNSLTMDLSKVRKVGNSYYINRDAYEKQIESQIPGGMSLLEVDRDTMFVYFEKLHSKKVPVVPNLVVELAQNHILEDSLVISPSSITIKGPKKEIDTVEQINTLSQSLQNVSQDFSVQLDLAKIQGLENTIFEVNSVEISGKVFRFSEQMIEIPVRVINLPAGVEIKTFPHAVSVLCKARIDRLKSLRPEEFDLVADFNSARADQKLLEPRLEQWPEGVYNAQVMDKEVQFILIRR
ncbi:MAG: YbbR-like domain-containing protein [Flavobacteriaceae bacterium]